MKAALVAALLPGLALLALRSHAQANYGTSVYFTWIHGPEVIQTEWPDGVAADSTGTAYVIYSASTGGTTLRKIVPGANTTHLFAPAGASLIAVDAHENLYFSSGLTILKSAPGGVPTRMADIGALAAGAGLDPRSRPNAIAVDASGNVYVSIVHAILKISPGGVVTTLAGKLGEAGSADGTSSARLNSPMGIAVDGGGMLFVADFGNNVIRKISPEGVVSTFAGQVGSFGREDEVGSAARFRHPSELGIDGRGVIYVTDSSVSGEPDSSVRSLRRITPDGVVTTLATTGPATTFGRMAVDAHGIIYGTDDWLAGVCMSVPPPAFTALPLSQTVTPGAAATFSAGASSNVLVSYQWLKDSVDIPDATNAELHIANVQPSDLAHYSVRATNVAGSVVSNPAALSFPAANASGLVNLSIRSRASTGEETLIVGFIIDGAGATDAKPLLIRGVGPALGDFGVPDALADPQLTVFSGASAIASNNNWNGDAQVAAVGAQLGAFSFASATSRDAALHHHGLGAGAYTVQISGVGGTSGVALAEIYDATPAAAFTASTPRLINLSARTHVGTGADVLIAGFSVGGTAPKTLLIRAVGPTLSAFGVTGVLVDPTLELFQGNSVLQSNDNWSGDAQVAATGAQVGAFPLASNSNDAALVVTLPPGSYTAQVSGVANATGIALVEIYEVP